MHALPTPHSRTTSEPPKDEVVPKLFISSLSLPQLLFLLLTLLRRAAYSDPHLLREMILKMGTVDGKKGKLRAFVSLGKGESVSPIASVHSGSPSDLKAPHLCWFLHAGQFCVEGGAREPMACLNSWWCWARTQAGFCFRAVVSGGKTA